MKYLFVLNDPPYGTERSYNGLRMAGTLAKSRDENNEVCVFMIGDAVFCAKRGQQVPQGCYHIESLTEVLTSRNSSVGVCGTCMKARAMTDDELVDGAHRSSMADLGQ